jgi:hypothetical protein
MAGLIMARPSKDELKSTQPEDSPEAWERFRGAVHALAKAKPHHREAPKLAVKSGPKRRTSQKGKIHEKPSKP